MFFRYEGEIVYLITNMISEIWNIFSCTRSLLVLDDIWDSWVLKAFDNQCQVLITSRDRSVTDAVSGKEWSSLLHYKSWMYVCAKCFCELIKELIESVSVKLCTNDEVLAFCFVKLCFSIKYILYVVLCICLYWESLHSSVKLACLIAAVFQLIISTYEVVSEPDPLLQIFLQKFSQLP